MKEIMDDDIGDFAQRRMMAKNAWRYIVREAFEPKDA